MSKMKEPGGRLGNSIPPEDNDPDEATEPSEYETKDHIDTLMKAEQIKADPIKMKHVHKLAGRHQKAIKSIQDLHDVYQQKFGAKKPSGQGGV